MRTTGDQPDCPRIEIEHPGALSSSPQAFQAKSDPSTDGLGLFQRFEGFAPDKRAVSKIHGKPQARLVGVDGLSSS